MPSKLLAAALLSASAALVPMPAHLAAAEPQADAAPADDAQARDLLAEGVKEYRIGRFAAAARAFAQALAAAGDDRTLFHWYLAAGDALVVQMQAYDELAPVMAETLRRARIYQTALRRDPAYIAQVLGKLAGTDEERVAASLELIAVGPAAVPQLIAHLGGERQDELAPACRVVLTRMAGRAVLPLAEALRSDDRRLQTAIATILADVGDPRALPRLVVAAADATLDDTTRLVLARAADEIRRAAGLAPAAPEDLFFAEAQRYFRGGERVEDEMLAADAMIWRWDAAADPAVRLGAVRVPGWAWNEAVAEQMVFDGLALAPGAAAFQPLLAAVLAAQLAEVEGQSAPGADPAAREARAAEQRLRIRMAGSALYGAVAEALAAEREATAALLLRQLEDRWLARPEQNLAAPGAADATRPGGVLSAALSHPDKRVRYQAAITLARLDPAAPFQGAELVVPVLAEAVAESGPRVVLVVEPDWRYRNAAREQLQSRGYVVATAADPFEALQHLGGAQVVDAVVVAGDAVAWMRDAGGQRVAGARPGALALALLADPRLAGIPVFAARPEDPAAAEAMAQALEGRIAGQVKKPYAGIDLDAGLRAALSPEPGDAARAEAEGIALRACQALQVPDPRRTLLDLPRAAAALAATLDHRSDAVRIAALGALGNAAQARGGEAVRGLVQRVTDVYEAQDGSLQPELRIALLRAIGLLDPATAPAQAILARALSHADAAVQHAAAEAIGHGAGLPPDLLARLQAARRPAATAPAP